MNNFPLPNPDRRSLKKDSTQDTNNDDILFTNNNNKFKKGTKFDTSKHISINNNEKEDYEKMNNLEIVKLKHIEDMRKNLLSYKLLSDKTMFLTSNAQRSGINQCNIILFGPSGSGKSSLIKSIYRSLYNSAILPPEAMSKLIIKDTFQNEGTVQFTQLHLKEANQNSSGIMICDTRGHIRMNENEKEQFKLMIEGKVKENMVIEQKKQRDSFKFWEFWKKDSELFPNEIFNVHEPGLETFPHNIILVFDGSTDDIIEPDDEKFYKNLVDICHRKGYSSIHVILTRIDVFEKQIIERNKSLPSTERSTKVNTLKDEKIERVIEILHVNRSNIHFIENYHSDTRENLIEIDYHILKTLGDIINACEMFILYYLNRNETCFANCFMH